MPEKILHVIDSLSVGGAENLLVGLINGLGNEFEQHLIILRGPETLRAAITAPVKISTIECSSVRNIFFKRRALRKYIKDSKIDIVHSHLYEANLLARLGTPKNVKLFNSIHAISSLASYNVNRLTLWLERITYKKRHRIISVSKEVEKDFDKWVGIKGPATVLYNYIDEKYFNNAGKPGNYGSLRLIAVGNLRYQKNYPYLVRAFKHIPDGASLDIYGDGPMRNELQEAIDRDKLPIRLCGLRNDLEKVIPTYDGFVMSSFYEGQPLALLEAMACAVPPLLADIPVLREVVNDEAVYFNLNDDKDFSRAINEIRNGQHDLRAMAARNFEQVNSFAHRHQYVEALIRIYREL